MPWAFRLWLCLGQCHSLGVQRPTNLCQLCQIQLELHRLCKRLQHHGCVWKLDGNIQEDKLFALRCSKIILYDSTFSKSLLKFSTSTALETFCYETSRFPALWFQLFTNFFDLIGIQCAQLFLGILIISKNLTINNTRTHNLFLYLYIPIFSPINIWNRDNMCCGRTSVSSLSVELVWRSINQAYDMTMISMVKHYHVFGISVSPNKR